MAMRAYAPRNGGVRLQQIVLCVAVALASRGVAVSADDDSNTTSAPSTYQPWMACMRANTVGDVCDVQSVCTRCLRTDGCGFDTLVRECVLLPEGGRAMYLSSSNPLLNRTNPHYCSDTDATCTTCAVTPSNPFCEGSDGSCVCPSMCESMRASQLICTRALQSSMVYISFAVMAVVLPLLAVIHRVFTRGCRTRGDDLHAELQRMRDQRRRDLAYQRQRERQRPPSALALQLESWRTHRDAHKVEIAIVEPLKDCYVLLENDTAVMTTHATPTPAAAPTVLPTSSAGVETSNAATISTVNERRSVSDDAPLPNADAATSAPEMSSRVGGGVA